MSDSKIASATRLIERSGKDAVLLVHPARLIVVGGAADGQEVLLEGRSVQVGSDASNDLVLSDPSVSAAHFSIELDSAGFLLRDRGSTNGTFVDGYRVQAIYLPSTAQIAAGESRLRFSTSADEVEIPLSNRTRFGDLLGHSAAMRQVFAILERVAATDTSILLEGESGTGKEVAARAIHDSSARREELFVAVDCGSLPASLIESELFGHAKGAFTGAMAARVGLFEEADGGTLFLDEIGELPLDLQPKLLRTLETRAVRRVGETKPSPINTRLIAATNRNLAQEVEAGRFRRDLFFRLSVIRLRLPPLRERREEIPRLVSHFMSLLGRDPSQRLDDSTMEMLRNYCWPGNVRELRNAVERLVVLPGMTPEFYLDGASSMDASSASASGVPLDLPFHEGKRIWTERYEREYLGRLLAECKGNISEVARVSGLSRQSCHRLLSRYNLES
jgi:DNA-binding NtrC family response regulator